MALNQTNKLVWLVETIRRAGRISFEELNRRWMDNEDLSGGEELQKRTFHKWRDAIWDTFGLDIQCEKGGLYRYYIDNEEDMLAGSMASWLLSTYSVSNSIAESRCIKDRILLEDIPSGMKYLDSIIDAMKQNRLVHITYYNYWRGDERPHYVMPLCVKLFRQRWYFVGRSWTTGSTNVYCLDRIRNFRLSSHTFDYPEDFSPEAYFAGCMGVIPGTDTPIETVRLRVASHQANYLRDLPIGNSCQQEVECTDEYSIFELRIRPTFDFQQEILWNGPDMEVLSPEWLRKDISEKVRKMGEHYKK